jgi:general secretion pathway protein A
MYERYYGLQERPFDLSPNPRFLFLSKKHREALTHLQYALTGRPGLTVLIGEAGTGKTTLVRTAFQSLNGSAAGIVHLSNPTLTRGEFFEYLAAGFGFPAEAAVSKTRFLRELESALAAPRQPGKTPLALIVDEAQSLPDELLEEVRLLTNLESATGRTVAVILVGQPELAVRLNDSTLRQIKQRIALRCELDVLSLAETAAYIAARVRVAGGSAELLFTRDAVVAIHEHSKGIPRTISVICDNALVNGFAADVKPIGSDLVLEVCRDFQLGASHSGSTPRVLIPAASTAASTAPPSQTPRAAVEPSRDPAKGSIKGTLIKGTPNGATPAPDPEPMFSGFTRRRKFSFF